MSFIFLIPIVSGSILSYTVEGASDQWRETQEERDQRMSWWREARFGMFVHWGLYAIPAGKWDEQIWKKGGQEWIQKYANVPADVYAERLLPQFNPKEGFAEEWAQLARQAGCKYVVFTNKHHEGFALHDSKVTIFDAKDVTGRDLHKEIVNAIRAEGLKVGTYHSLWDWHHPHAYCGPGTNNPPCQSMEGRHPTIYVDFLHAQVREIISNYGRLDVMWFDYSSTEIQGISWRAHELMNMVRQQQPHILINNRLFRSPEAGWVGHDGKMEAFDNLYGDFCTPEQKIPDTGIDGIDWETCMTMNNSWGYTRYNDDFKSPQTLIRNLVDIASKGGNYLLNIGPMADGSVPWESVERMQAIGKWMAVNGEAIYGTSASPIRKPDWGRITAKPGEETTTLYLHVFEWPQDGQLHVPIANEVITAYLLADKSRTCQVSSGAHGLTIRCASRAVDPISSTIVVKIKGHTRKTQ